MLCLVTQSCPTLCDLVDCSLPGSFVHWDPPGKNTGVVCHALLQGIFPTQGWNRGLLHYRQILCQLRHQGSPLTAVLTSNKHYPGAGHTFSDTHSNLMMEIPRPHFVSDESGTRALLRLAEAQGSSRASRACLSLGAQLSNQGVPSGQESTGQVTRVPVLA